MAIQASIRAQSVRFGSSAPLPVHLTALVGRSREIGEVTALLDAGRLVSLVGAGGSGKSRLAAAVAASQQGRYRDAVGWIELGALTNPADVDTQLAAALGLREQADGSSLDAVIALIGRGAALLVMDNCEHVIAAATVVIDKLLRGCPSLRILVTSRQALGIAGEKAWLVPPLALPATVAEAVGSDAVQLFVQRAKDVAPAFALTDANTSSVVHICRRLDGLPLPIELAAARVKLLPPEQLAARLDSTLNLLSSNSQLTLPRHRTLRALIDWSHDLLSPDERRLLARLSVFVGGFTLEAAERVVSDDSFGGDHVLDLLAGLVDKSLVTSREWYGEARFRLLETVRQYAWEKLEESGEVEVMRARHAAFFVEVAEAAEPHIQGGTRATPWMARLEHEHGNLRAVAEWCGERQERAEVMLRLSTALHWFHFALGHFDDARRRLQMALDTAGDLPPRVRGRALATQGYQAFWVGDHAAVHPPLAAAVELLREAGNATDLAFALTGLATAAGLAGQIEPSYALFTEAERVLGDPDEFSRVDFPRALLYAFGNYWRGAVALSQGDIPLARNAYETAVRVARNFGNHPSIAHPLAALARVLVIQGELEAAGACLAESVPIHAANEDYWGLIQAVEVAAMYSAVGGRPDRAATLLGAADGLRARIGAAPAPHEQAERERLIAAIREALGDNAYQSAAAEGWGLGIDQLLEAVVGPDRPTGAGGSSLASEASDPSPVAATIAPIAGDLPGAQLRVRALGPLRIFLGDRPLAGEAFGSSKPRELLLLLLTHTDGCTREQVGIAFWPDASSAQVKNSFHVTLHRLRKALEHPDWIVVEGERYRLDPRLRIDFDALRFEEDVTAALRDSGKGAEVETRLSGAISLCGGEFLEMEPVGDWHLEIRDRLRRLHRKSLLALADLRIVGGRFEEAADACRALLLRDQLHEPAYRRLMLCLDRSGQKVEALRLHETLVVLLREQLGTRPDPETTALFEQIRQGSPLPLPPG